MSDLYRSAMSARLAKLPPDLPPAMDVEEGGDPLGLGGDFVTRAPGYEEEDDDEESETDGLGDLPRSGLGPPAVPPNPHLQRLNARLNPHNPRTRNTKDHKPNPAHAPLSAAPYFAESAQIPLPDRGLDVRVYYTAPGGASYTAPGVGTSSDPGAHQSPDPTTQSPTHHQDPASLLATPSDPGALLVAHHGAGYSGLSFACLAGEITSTTRGALGVLAMDARRHGKTVSLVQPEPEDLSITTLVADLVALLTTMFPDPARAPGFLLTGHSMGGSVVARACPVLVARKYRLIGVSVLDAVEGHALPALPAMHGLLAGRPEGFQSLEDAVGWHTLPTYRISALPTYWITTLPTYWISTLLTYWISTLLTYWITPDGTPPPYKYVWRTPLRTTAAYWRGWFEGLSQAFLDAKTARLLVLAGTDRLDKPLMIGQMQGRFQLEVVPDVGHLLHEDNPTKLAEIHVNFWRRNERVIVGVKKVGEE
ncbi:Alpha/Beta hydrolase protein [Schizophyllum commune]